MDLLQPMLLTSLALPRALPFYLAWDDLNALKLCDMALQRSDLLEWKPLDGLVHLIHAMRLRPQVYGNLLDTWLRLSQGVSAAYDIEGQRILFQLRTIIQATQLSVFSQWIAQCIILGVPFSCQSHLANINRCWITLTLAPWSLIHLPLMTTQGTSFYVLQSNYGSCGTHSRTLCIF